MPRKKDYSTMSGAQLGRAMILNNVAARIIIADDEQKQNMKQYQLKKDDIVEIYRHVKEDFSTEEQEEFNNYVELNGYIDFFQKLYQPCLFQASSEINELTLYASTSIGMLNETDNTEAIEHGEEYKSAAKELSIENNIKDIPQRIYNIKSSMGTVYAFIAFFDILSKKLRMPQLSRYFSHYVYGLTFKGDTEGAIARMNLYYSYYKAMIAAKSATETNETEKARLNKIYEDLCKLNLPIDVDSIKPTAKDIASVKFDISIFSKGTAKVVQDVLLKLDKGGFDWGGMLP